MAVAFTKNKAANFLIYLESVVLSTCISKVLIQSRDNNTSYLLIVFSLKPFIISPKKRRNSSEMKLLSFLFGKAEDRKQGRSKEINQIQYIIHISQKIKTSLYVMPSKQKLLCQ